MYECLGVMGVEMRSLKPARLSDGSELLRNPIVVAHDFFADAREPAHFKRTVNEARGAKGKVIWWDVYAWAVLGARPSDEVRGGSNNRSQFTMVGENVKPLWRRREEK